MAFWVSQNNLIQDTINEKVKEPIVGSNMKIYMFSFVVLIENILSLKLWVFRYRTRTRDKRE